MKEIEIKGIVVKYDIDKLLKDCTYIYDDDYEEYSESEDKEELGSGYYMTKEDFDSARETFYNNIRDLDNIIPNIIEKTYLYFTKKGALDKRKNIVIIDSGIISDYSNEYGSHNYKVHTILASPTGDKELTIYYYNKSQQDSF